MRVCKRDACATSMRAGVALGSNLGDPLENLREARQSIAQIPGVTSPILASAIYETDPVDCEPGAPSFLNAVLEFGFDGDPVDLLPQLRKIEIAMGRPIDHVRNSSRKIDIDLLYGGETRIDRGQLQLPHPRMEKRRFVLEPLAEIRPGLTLPGQTKNIRELLAALDSAEKVVRLTSDWGLP